MRLPGVVVALVLRLGRVRRERGDENAAVPRDPPDLTQRGVDVEAVLQRVVGVDTIERAVGKWQSLKICSTERHAAAGVIRSSLAEKVFSSVDTDHPGPWHLFSNALAPVAGTAPEVKDGAAIQRDRFLEMEGLLQIPLHLERAAQSSHI